MADGVAITAGSGTSIATDDIGGVHHQRVKLSLGADGSATDALGGAGATAAGVQRVVLANDDALIGAVAETAPATDTASSGLNGRLQRIAQNITTLTGRIAQAAHDAAISGNPMRLAGRARTPGTPYTAVSADDVADLTTDLTGNLNVAAISGDAGGTVTATISSGTSLSGSIDLGRARAARIEMPAAWDTANLTFQTSVDNSTFNNLFDSTGAEVTVSAAAGRAIRLDFADWLSIRYLKIRSGTSASAVNQTASRTINIAVVN